MRKLGTNFVFALTFGISLAACGAQKATIAQSEPFSFAVENPVFAYDETFDNYADCHDQEARNRHTLIVNHEHFFDDMFLDFPGSQSISWTGEWALEGQNLFIVFYRAEPSEADLENNSLLYNPENYLTLEQVKAKFPVDEEGGHDFRYVPFYTAHEELKDAVNLSWTEDQAHRYVDLLFHLKTRFCIAAGG